VAESDQDRDSSIASRDDAGDKAPIPLNMKIISVIIVSMIGFGGHWSSGVTGALKSTLKKVCLVPPCLSPTTPNTPRNYTSATPSSPSSTQARTSSRPP
jgi:hypothetical protein